ncbi:FAD dependent oxidoreductase [Hydrogenophaga taeniospiralis CCUG 15921]|uniref:FAD dependent oxidoreductase n=1 Tax=Hydrogenophaga taeniospiralis CCUG 15921 TaxID=1281780 RepID=A0A9X4NQI8_9BURK|nr:FAD-dependent oxidoreductase [Hydrogenophaga taeniospiralis]MDG5974729.1 FAD dependent oxidoreductase [Hydrogenophaga taeniospiralis CCUG 15921]
MASIGIAGAGLLGRLLAWRLGATHDVTVFDPADGPQATSDGRGAAAFTAAGMLSPLAELETSGPRVAELGWRSIALWREIAQALSHAPPAAGALPEACGTCTACAPEPGAAAPADIHFRALGSLLLAHGSDLGAARRVLARLETAPTLAAGLPAPQALDRAALAALEPSIDPRLHAWLLPGEGQILPLQMLLALCAASPRVRWRWNTRVLEVAPGQLKLEDGSSPRFDLAIDVRGVGARPDAPVRGVRGEVVWLQAPGVTLHRPVRLLHPRHRVYIVPRPCDHIVIGASEIESEDRSPVSLKSAVELMAAAQSVIPELAEARIVHLETNLRPALPDNEPRTEHQPGLLRINGLFRHGWLLAPALVQDALEELGLPPAPPRGFPPPVPEGGRSLPPGQARAAAALERTLR